MVADFTTVRVADVALEMGDAPFGSDLKTNDYTEGGALVVQGKNVQGRVFDWSDRRHVSLEKWRSIPRSHCYPGDLIFPKVGTIGKIGILSECPGYEHYLLSTNTMRLRVDPKKANPLFVYYYFTWSRTVDLITALNSKSVQPVFNYTTLRNFLIDLPPLSEQQAIGCILGTLDDKIELNRRMNETLEAMAQAIFKLWFVDFDPVRAKAEGRDPGLPKHIADLFPDRFEDSELGEIPARWEVRSLDKIANYLNGLALQKFPLNGEESLPAVKIAQLRAGHTKGADRVGTNLPPEYVIEDGDVLFSWSGSLEVEIWCGGRGALNQDLFKVTSALFPKWFVYLWTRHHLSDFQNTAANKATTMGHIQRQHLTEAKALVPPANLLNAMNQQFAPLIDKLVANRVESRSLAALRDTLLPKLLSGELRVQDAATKAEAVA